VFKPLQLSFPYTIWTDGAARGRHNGQGPSSCGFVVRDREGNHVYSAAWALGPHTNNFAEYQGLIKATHWAVHNLHEDVRYVHFKTDSELMERQINRIYSVKHPDIIPLYHKAVSLLDRMMGFKIEHVRREFNKEADAICNRVLDAEKERGIKFVEDNSRSGEASSGQDSQRVPGHDGPAESAGIEGQGSSNDSGDSRLRVRSGEERRNFYSAAFIGPAKLIGIDLASREEYSVGSAVPEVPSVQRRSDAVRMPEGDEC
jgi:ribonuclease HI